MQRRVSSDRRVLSAAVGLTISGKIYKRYFDGAMDSDDVLEALKHLQKHIPGKFVLVWDRIRIHTSAKTKAFLAEHPEIIVEWLPRYAPELNPEEFCHGNVKEQAKNALPANKEELRRVVDRGFARLRRRPDLLLSFFHLAGLTLNQLW